MAQAQPISFNRHPYADGSAKKMLIDGKWVNAASGKTFESHNPATGELLATVAEGDKADIDSAVAAARRAFEGPWSKFTPFERQNLLLKFADLIEKHFDEQTSTTDSEVCRSDRKAFRRAFHPRYARHGCTAQPHPGRQVARAWHAAVLCWTGDIDPRRDD